MNQFTRVRFGLTLVTMAVALTMGANGFAACPCTLTVDEIAKNAQAAICSDELCTCGPGVNDPNCTCGCNITKAKDAGSEL